MGEQLDRSGLMDRIWIALSVVVGAFALRAGMVAWIGGELPRFLTFYPAIMLSALVGGFTAGVVASAASAVLAWIWILPPVGHLKIEKPPDALALALFLAIGVFMSAVGERYRRQRARAVKLEKELMAREHAARVRTIGDNIPDSALYSYVRGTSNQHWFTYLSSGIERLIGVSPNQILRDASVFYEIIVPEDRRLLEQAEVRSREGLSVLEAEVRVRHRQSGELRWARLRSTPRREPDGSTAWEGIVIDVTASKRNEEMLRRYELLAAHARDIVLFARHEDGRILEANAAAVSAYGFSRDQLLDLTIRDLHAPASVLHTEAQMRQAFDGGLLFETVHRRKDGSTFPVEVSSRGETVGGTPMLISVIRDIHERKRIETELRRQREWLRVMVTSIGDAVLATDKSGRITFMNPVAASLTGWSADEALGEPVQSVFQVLDEQTGKSADDIISRVPHSGETINQLDHMVLQARDGRRIPIENSAAPIKDDRGEVSGAVIVFHDVTDKRRAQQTLKESERRFQQKLESILSPQGDIGKLELADLIDAQAIQALMESFYRLTGILMAIVDLNGRVLVCVGWQDVCVKFHRANPLSCRNCRESDTQLSAGVPTGEYKLYKCKNNMWDVATPLMVGGRHVGNIFTGQFFLDDDHVDYAVFREQAHRYGFPEDEYLEAVRRVPRIPRAALQECMQFFGKLAHMISQLTFRNLEIARSLAERDRLTVSLREADARKNEFLAVLSHELRNPLAPIRNSLYILERAAPGGEQAKRALAVIDRQVGHTARLVDDLLDVTRISRGKITLQRERLDLCALVRRTAEDHREVYSHNALRFEVKVPDEPLWVDGDPTRLSQVIGNLLSNAAKFTPQGGSTVLSIDRNGRHEAVISVRDSGVGISPETLPRLFQPFAQGRQTIDRSRGGLGLGLALVRGLVEQHGGTVIAKSDGEGAGTEVVVTLPLQEPTIDHALEMESLSGTGSRARRVLIVEDNIDAADSLREALELGGHEVAIAHSGPEGIQLAHSYKPDVVLCDIGLPGVDGYGVATALRRDRDADLRSTFLVALSGYALQEDIMKSREAGFDCHVAKPPSIATLEKLLSQVPSSRSSSFNEAVPGNGGTRGTEIAGDPYEPSVPIGD